MRSFLLTSAFALFALSSSAQRNIGCGYGHALSLCADSTVMAWGWDLSGQLGNTYASTTGCQCLPHTGFVWELRGAVAVACGEYHSMALLADGTVRSWGLNGTGQLGFGPPIAVACDCATSPVPALGLTNVTAISAGWAHSLGLRGDGTVWGWGNNADGEVGDGSGFQQDTAVQAAGLSDVTFISAGEYHSLAIRSDSTVWAWGKNDVGQLGDSTTTDRLTPVQVHGLSDVIAVDGGLDWSLAVKSDGTVWGWGSNYWNDLLDTSVYHALEPVRIEGLNDIIAVAAGWRHGLALRSDSTVWAWGWNYEGELGIGVDHVFVDSIVQVAGLSGIAQIDARFNFSSALKSDGTVWMWGDNYYGQLGNETRISNPTAAPVHDLCPVSITTSIEDTGLNAITALPNPSDGRFQLVDPEHAVQRVEVRDLLGALVRPAVTTDTSDARIIDLSGSPNGLYLLLLSGEDGRRVIRLVKD